MYNELNHVKCIKSLTSLFFSAFNYKSNYFARHSLSHQKMNTKFDSTLSSWLAGRLAWPYSTVNTEL